MELEASLESSLISLDAFVELSMQNDRTLLVYIATLGVLIDNKSYGLPTTKKGSAIGTSISVGATFSLHHHAGPIFPLYSIAWLDSQISRVIAYTHHKPEVPSCWSYDANN
jgi:hypothetical protein